MKRLASLPVLVPCLGLAILLALMIPRNGLSEPALEGSRVPDRLAPNFQLKDQWGRQTTVEQFRGTPVLLTFLEAHCEEECPFVAEKIRDATGQLGRAGGKVAALVVSTDPEGDTRQAVLRFSRQHGMARRWRYLTGTRKQLAAVWRAYHIYAASRSAPDELRDAHTSAIYLIDRAGHQRVLLGADVDLGTLVHDLQILSGLPADAESSSSAAPALNRRAPDFALRDLSGRVVRLREFRGKVVLLNFWATWCVPCRSEVPRLNRWYRRLREQGLVVLGVNKQEDVGEVRSFVRTFHVPYPVVLDVNGSAVARYNLAGLPVTYLIDRRGIVRSRHLGEVDDSYLRTETRLLLRYAGQ